MRHSTLKLFIVLKKNLVPNLDLEQSISKGEGPSCKSVSYPCISQRWWSSALDTASREEDAFQVPLELIEHRSFVVEGEDCVISTQIGVEEILF